MTRRVIAGALLVLTLGAACAEPNVLDQGTVVDREYDDPDTSTSMYCQVYYPTNPNGGGGGCMIWGEDTDYDGPHWKVQVIGRDAKGKEHKEWHEVTERFYEIAKLGVVINFPNEEVVPQ